MFVCYSISVVLVFRLGFPLQRYKKYLKLSSFVYIKCKICSVLDIAPVPTCAMSGCFYGESG